MHLSVDSWIDIVRPHLDKVLVGVSQLEQIRTVARAAPADCMAVFESRLARGAERVDFSIRLTDPGEACEWAAGGAAHHIRRLLCQKWAELGHPRPIPSVWLEFDFDARPGRQRSPLMAARLTEGADGEWLVRRLLPALQGSPLSSRQRRRVRQCVEQMPESISLLYAFGMGTRSAGLIRLELFSHRLDSLQTYLRQLAPHLVPQLTELVPIAEGCQRYHLSFDISQDGTHIEPRIGLECGFERWPHHEPGWSRLFDRLQDYGLCSAEKRQAVFAWPGTDSLLTATRQWPEQAIPAGGFCVRCLSHVKLVTWPDRQPEAKVYLLFQHVTKKSLLARRPQPKCLS